MIDEMGSRIDELEQSINDLRAEMGQERTPSPSTSLKPKEDPKAADSAEVALCLVSHIYKLQSSWHSKRAGCIEMKDLKESVSKDLKELVEAQRVSAEQKHVHGTSYMDKLGFASLTVWNMKTWKAMTVLPLGEDPPAITSLCFNHNGKILAAAATDGMIHIETYMSAGLQITGWPAHDSAISSVLFGPDETSIFSLGIDGKLAKPRFCNHDNSEHRHEMALDGNGKRLLATSGSVRPPIYQGGSLYRLIHRADAGECISPLETKKKMLMLRSSDGEEFATQENVAVKSTTIKNMVEDGYVLNVIPVPNVDAKTLAVVIEYCKKHAESEAEEAARDLIKFDSEFLDRDQEVLCDLIMTTNFLDVKELLVALCQTVADMIKGKSPDEIRKIFNIKNDFTPEEEEKIRKENSWAFE
ncbi:unnamed protein product [Camellia sinensis]